MVIAKAGENKAKTNLGGQRDLLEAAVRASKIDQAIRAITPQSADAATAVEGSSGNESDFPALNASEGKRPIVFTLTDISSDDEQDIRSSGFSSPKRSRVVAARLGVRAQQLFSHAEASNPVQTEAVVSEGYSLPESEGREFPLYEGAE